MFVHHRTQGIVFKKVDQGESDQLFTVYTKDLGKIRLLAKGIRKSTSKLRAGIDVFYLSEIEFIQGKAYKTLTDAALLDKFVRIRTDLSRLSVAYKIAELLDGLIYGKEKETKVWILLSTVFKELDKSIFRSKNLKLLYYYFFWNLFAYLGYKPRLDRCTICHNNLKPETLYFNSKEGGVICRNCFSNRSFSLKVGPEEVKILRLILEKDWRTVARIKITDRYIELLGNVSNNNIEFFVESKKD